KFPVSILISSSQSIEELLVKNKTELKKALAILKSNAHNIVGYDIKSWGSYFKFCGLKQIDANDLYVMAALDDSGRGKKTIQQMSSSYLGVAPVDPPGQLGLEGITENQNQNSDLERIAKVLYLQELYGEINARLQSKEVSKLYLDIERPLTPIIGEIETHGVLVDRAKLKVISKDIHERCRKFEEEIHSYAGQELNVNSPKQLQVVLFDQLGLTPIKKTKTGASTDAATLNALIDQHPIVPAILNYREVEKLRSTYIDALEPLIASDGRIHATFNQALTSTGRISSEAPNLQNIPIRSEDGKKLREMFVAPKGFVLCAIDYSQIELRILAHLSGEKTLLDAFNRGEDVHGTTAAKVFEVDQKDVTSEQRSFAKVVNFGIAYGMESYGLASRMGIDPGHAKEILDSYWASFSDMKQYLDDVVEEAKKLGYTQTMFGRRRYFPELSSPVARMRIAGARAATNAPVQGSAADIFKLAMVEVAKHIADNDLPASTVLTVHDELVFEIDEDEVDEVSGQIAKVMENVVELKVPLVADVGIGSNWAEAK
ncbi:MAG TPA: DNA polymerase, partial [Acidimicrobiia bacterium]|nr:DNA polymerase [Acidimicrobiia bacterium]